MTCFAVPKRIGATLCPSDVTKAERACQSLTFRHTGILTYHEKREPWLRPGGTTFYFINDGPERALELARESAGSRDIRTRGWSGRDPAVPEPGCRRRAGNRLGTRVVRRRAASLREPTRAWAAVFALRGDLDGSSRLTLAQSMCVSDGGLITGCMDASAESERLPSGRMLTHVIPHYNNGGCRLDTAGHLIKHYPAGVPMRSWVREPLINSVAATSRTLVSLLTILSESWSELHAVSLRSKRRMPPLWNSPDSG